MKRMLFTALAALTILAAAFIASPLSSADDLTKSKASVTFNKDVAPILFKNCVECHRPGEAAPMSLLSYKEARPWARSIREKVVSREMPPWHADPRVGQFSNDASLTRDQIDAITAWVDGGAKEGDPRDLPPAPKFVEGWGIGQPDAILKMPEEFTLEANGPDEYHHFLIDTGFTEDKYVQMAEARPGNRRIVHHIIALIIPPPPGVKSWKAPPKEELEKWIAELDPILYSERFLRRLRPSVPVHNDGCQLPSGGSGNQLDGSGDFFTGMILTEFLPGVKPAIWEPGTVKRIPAGAKIALEVHYSRTTGQVEKDRSMIGLIFAKQPPRKELFSRMISKYLLPDSAWRGEPAGDVLLDDAGRHPSRHRVAAYAQSRQGDGDQSLLSRRPLGGVAQRAQVRLLVADQLHLQAIQGDSEGDQIHGDRVISTTRRRIETTPIRRRPCASASRPTTK